MKGIGTLLLCTALAVLLSACGKAPAPRMYIEAAQLTEQEQNIADLLDSNPTSHIYDFSLDDTVASIHFNTYELVDGQWQPYAGDNNWAFQDASGRLALRFGKIPDGMQVALQSQHHGGATSHSIEQPQLEGMSVTTSSLASPTEVVYEQEIPLAIQILTTKNEVHSYTVDAFFHPEKYAPYGYEHIYAITVMFSQKPLSD